MELILATRNAHKILEVSRMLEPYGLTVAPLPDNIELPPEDGETFEANALPKARTAARALGVPVIADDSGIESAALHGRPGVRSARFAGEHATDAENLAKLLAQAPAGSELRYVCALAFVDGSAAGAGSASSAGAGSASSAGAGSASSAGAESASSAAAPGSERVFFGECRGRLAAAPAGSGGFGYDPAFIPVDRTDELTMAELSEAEKDAISHRGHAVRAFAEWFTSAGLRARRP
jgi:XTP/dITP diphosphohydrolase